MIADVFIQCHSLFIKDYAIFKLIFIGVASFLIYDTIYDFAVLKPTYNSQEERQLSFDDFPEILICPEPSTDLNASRANGYRNYYFYFSGLFGSHDSSSNKHFEPVLVCWGFFLTVR